MEISNNGQQDILLDADIVVQSPIQKHLMDTTVISEESEAKKKQLKKSKKKNSLGENKELYGIGEQKQFVPEILDVKEMEISNSGLQDTPLGADLPAQSPIQKHLTDTTANIEENKNKKRKRERKPKAQCRESLQSLDQTEVVSALNEVDMERASSVEKPHTSTADMLTLPEVPPADLASVGYGAHLTSLLHQPDGISKVVVGVQVTDAEAEGLIERKPCSMQSPIQKNLLDTTTIPEKSKRQKENRKRKLRKKKKRLAEKTEVYGIGEQKQSSHEILEVKEMEISNFGLQDTPVDADLTAQSPIQKHLMDATAKLEERKKRKRKKNENAKARRRERLRSLDQTKVVSALSLSDNLQSVGGNDKLNNLQSTNQEFPYSANGSSRHCDESDDKLMNHQVTVVGNMNNFSNISHLSPERIPYARLRRKLLVLDVNGLLADIIRPVRKELKSSINIFNQAVFMRPYCREFLAFCFLTFDVSIWSSKSKTILKRIVSFLFQGMEDKLVFFWDVSHCTKTPFMTLENRKKPIVFKELKKVWEKNGPDVPWKQGHYNESNTVLLDDSPYKALLNPAHTGIFPLPYSYKNEIDNSLGPEGDLRRYLEGLAKADNCKEYVEKHPFGQSGINESSSHWDFYSKIIRSQSNRTSYQRR